MISANANINLTIFEGASFYQEFTWLVETEPVDLTGYEAILQARDAIEDAEPVINLTEAPSGGIVILNPPADGKYAISLPPSATRGLCLAHEKRTLVYDLFFLAPANMDDAGLQQSGKITIIPAVTRP
jgi:hypothetical protein